MAAGEGLSRMLWMRAQAEGRRPIPAEPQHAQPDSAIDSVCPVHAPINRSPCATVIHGLGAAA